MPLTRIDTQSNAFSFTFPKSHLNEIKETYRSEIAPMLDTPELSSLFEGGAIRRGAMGQGERQYYYVTYDKEAIFWISNNTRATYSIFERFFDNLAISAEVKNLVDYDEDITLYSGFLVASDRAHNPAWHDDYAAGANAYTLLTPLFEPDPNHGNLLYRGGHDETHTYGYKYGEAVIVGDGFSHSTEPFPQTEAPRILVSLTFGTDKLEHWPALKQTVGGQSDFMILPCGHQRGTCECLKQIGEAP